MAMPPSIDIVVRTKADAARSSLLFRALDSIQGQRGVNARPIVVVNGTNVDAATLAVLETRPGIFLHREQQASAGLAMAVGRSQVTAPYFTFLDDDDELIPDSLCEPLSWIEEHDECDVLISNGYIVKPDGSRNELIHIAGHARLAHPALGLLTDGWLVPGAFICRSAAAPKRMLGAGWSNMEWTRLAFELCAEHKRLHFMDVPTVLYHDTAGSLSKQTRHQEAQLELMAQVRCDVRLDTETRRAAARKYLRTLHHLAIKYRTEGRYFRAWRYHLGSLRLPYTFRYLFVTRKLILPIRRQRQSE